ncbi:RHS repeat protein [Tessaracoccus defluvii]|uniref:RHS repeat protein n=1 Tax=Tessaracoccus defluvii TaxID=1285901 RepID=A0A7H0H632_9ACTN|nr:RHS repeat protein [Tessaracoccus defluvii]QNP55998.1 RHS repeat protein [Tessaracoccus defluvii]
MHGDQLPSGSRSVTVTNSLGESATDYEYLNGQVYETQTFDGATLLSKSLSEFLKVATTATHARTGLPAAEAVVTVSPRNRSISTIAAGGTHAVTTATRFDSLGRALAVTESADGKPSVCTTTSYATNPTRNILLLPAEQNRYAGACPGSGAPTGELLDSQRYFYDGSTTLGAVPGAGNMTQGSSAVTNTAGTVEYATTKNTFDAYGRAVSATEYTGPADTVGRTFTTSFTPASGVATSMKTTNPLGQSQTQILDLRGRPTKVTTVAGMVTEVEYDALGRIVAVWEPGFPRSGPATTKHTYAVSPNGVDAITTQQAVSDGSAITYTTTIQLFDKFAQLVQTQSDAAGGGRVIDDVAYDSHGWAVKTNNHWYALGAPAASLVTTADSTIDSRTVAKYDQAGRPVETISYRGLVESRRSKTIYGGDRITQIPPAGGTTTQAIFDSLGNTVELRLYKTAPTVSGSTVTGGTFTSTKYEHDHDGQMVKLTDASGAVWTSSYDLAGRLISSSDPDAGTSTFAYNHTGELLSTTDARGGAGAVVYGYDVLGRKTSVRSGSPLVLQGEWTYDTLKPGLPTLAKTYLRGNQANVLVEEVTGYNGFGLPTGTKTTVPASEGALAGSYATTVSYTPTGSIKTATLPAAGGLAAETLTYGYDAQGLATTMTGANQYVTETVYNPFGQTTQVTGREGGTLVWSTTQDPETLQVTSSTLSAASAQPQVARHAYTYDQAGKITRIDSGLHYAASGQPNVRTVCYKFDPLQRLTDAWTATDQCQTAPTATANSQVGGVMPLWQSWTFDDVGNRLTSKVNKVVAASALAPTSSTYAYGTAGHAHALTSHATVTGTMTKTASYTYDAAGNTVSRTVAGSTQTNVWNPDGSLASVSAGSQVSRFVYSAAGSEVLRTDPAGTTLFLGVWIWCCPGRR